MRLYVVGVGPGDPELLTLKAKKILEETPLIFYPTGGKNSLALSIVKKVINLKQKKLVSLFFPMKKKDLNTHWEKLSKIILTHIKEFNSGVFITLGDPSLYCTFFYLYPYLKNSLELVFIPGVSSINACACAVPVSLGLGDETIGIVPANYINKIQYLNCDFDTFVFMKPNKSLNDLLNFLKQGNFKIYAIKNVSTPEEKVILKIDELNTENINYLTTIIVKK